METATPQQKLSEMYYDLTKAKDLLQQVRELPNHTVNFNPGECESINQLINTVDLKKQVITQLQTAI